MLAVALALGASVSWGLSDYLAGWTSRRLHVLAVVAVSQSCGFAIIAAVLLALRPPAPGAREALFALATGVVMAIGLLCLYRGMAIGAMGVVTPIAATAAAIPLTVGLVRGERPSTPQAVGMGVAFVGVVLAAREPGAGAQASVGRARLAAGVGLALGAALCGGLFITFLAEAAEGGTVWAVFLARCATLSLYMALVATRRPPLRLPRRDLATLLGIGVLDVSGVALFARATTEGLLSVVSILASLYPVLTIFLAHALLGERVARLQRVGSAGALGGAALIAAG